jgi:hypothetical protein
MTRSLRHLLGLWGSIVALPIILQAAVFYYSVNYGILRGPLVRDDAYTTLQALERISSFLIADPLAVNLRRVVHLWFHSPLANMQTGGALLVSGGNLLAAFALNFWCLSLALYFLLAKSRLEGTSLKLAITLLVALQPLAIASLLFIKADFKGGLFMAAGIFLFYRAVECHDSGLKLFGAASLSLAVISKTTAFYGPIFALGILILFEIYAFLQRWEESKSLFVARAHAAGELRIVAVCAAIVTTPYLFFFSLRAKDYVEYINFGLSAIWADGLTVLERAWYYSPASFDGAAIWGKLHLEFLLFSVIALAISIVRRKFSSALLLVMLCVAIGVYALPLVLASSSNIEYAGSAIGVVLGSTLVAIMIVAKSADQWRAYAVMAAVILFTLFTRVPLGFDPPSLGGAPQVDRFTKLEMEELGSAYQQIAETIAMQTDKPQPLVTVFFHHTAAVPPNLSIEYYRRTANFLDLMNVWNLSDDKAVSSALKTSDFLLAIVPTGPNKSVPGMNSVFPISADPGQADRCIATKSFMERSGSFPIPGGAIRLYRRKKDSHNEADAGFYCS